MQWRAEKGAGHDWLESVGRSTYSDMTVILACAAIQIFFTSAVWNSGIPLSRAVEIMGDAYNRDCDAQGRSQSDEIS
jgi:hypothetical protein